METPGTRDRRVVTPENVAKRLEKADEKSAAKRLRELEAALHDDDRSNEVAHINVYGVLDPEGIEKSAAEKAFREWSTLWSGMEWIRNVLVLLPITFTWLAFWLASRDYATAIQKNSLLNNSSFLYLWETGFGGNARVPLLTFSNTAIGDAALLAIIVVLTFFVHYRKDVAAQWAANDASRLRRDLEQVLWDIEKKLSIRRGQHTDAGVARDLLRAAKDFTAAGNQVRTAVLKMDGGAREWMSITTEFDLKLGQAAEQMNANGKALHDFGDGLTGTIDKMYRYVESANDTSRSLENAVKVLADAIQKNGTDQRKTLTDIANQLKMLEEKTQGWGHALRSATDDLGRAASQNSESVHSVAAAVVQVTELLAGQDTLVTTMKEMRDALEKERQATEKVVNGAKEAFAKAQQTNEASRAQVTAASQGAVEEMRVTAKTVSEEMKAASNAMKLAADNVGSKVESLKTTMTGSLKQLSEDQSGALGRIEVQLQGALDNFGRSMSKILEALLRREEHWDRTLRDGGMIRVQTTVPTLPLALSLGVSVFISICLVASLFLGILRFSPPLSNLVGFPPQTPTTTSTKSLLPAPTLFVVTTPTIQK